MRTAAASLARHGVGKLPKSVTKHRTASVTTAAAQAAPVQVTTLTNKIRVATEATPGHFSSVGLYVDAGSRYETPATSGVTHFLDRMAFKTTAGRTDEQMSTAIHSLGGQIMCTSSREAIMYQSSHFHRGTPEAVSLIADTVLNPAFLPQEIEAQRDAAFYEVRELSAKPEVILPEILHSVAYDHKGLGNSLLCPEDRIPVINEVTLREALKEWYRPERMVIAGAGMPHEELVELTERYFSGLKATSTLSPPTKQTPTASPHISPSSSPPLAKSLTRAASYLFPQEIDAQSATYTGGQHFILDRSQDFNHLYVAFEGVGIHDNDIYALATMQVLLGGGGSFSAGGPGKGMYSRLYTHILNYFPQVDHCASFHHIYTDSSLFGLFASFVPASSGVRGGNTPSQILPHLVHQLSLLLYTPIPAEELSRAKNQLKSSLMMALESRAIEVEDLGRQILVHNRKVPVTEMTDKIDQLNAEDIRNIAQKVFGPSSKNKPTIVCMGHEDIGSTWKETFRKYGVSV